MFGAYGKNGSGGSGRERGGRRAVGRCQWGSRASARSAICCGTAVEGDDRPRPRRPASGSSASNWERSRPRRHEVRRPGGQPGRDQLRRAVQVQEEQAGCLGAQPVAVAAAQRRAADHAAPVAALGDPAGDRVQPGRPVGVVQRVAGRHLGDVRRRVEVVGLGVRHAEPLGEQGADRRLARARHPHDHDHGELRGCGRHGSCLTSRVCGSTAQVGALGGAARWAWRPLKPIRYYLFKWL